MGETGIAVGDLLDGKYEVQKLLGSGAMGLVFDAFQKNLNRRIAIKTLRAEFAAHPQLIARFQQEARAASSIGHPSIVQIFDTGCTKDGSHFIVMEKLEGQSVEELLEGSPLVPIAAACSYIIEALGGLSAAHRKGIVHRDIKPGNIFIQRNEDGTQTIKLLDFGVSKILRSADPLIGGASNATKHGSVIGTPLYMSPEQAQGEEVDGRADIWSIGCVLYEMLCGQTPFKGEHPAIVIANILAGTIIPPRQLRPELSPKLSQVVSKALSHRAEDRYQSADDFTTALREAHTSGPSSGAFNFDLAEGTETISLDSILGTAKKPSPQADPFAPKPSSSVETAPKDGANVFAPPPPSKGMPTRPSKPSPQRAAPLKVQGPGLSDAAFAPPSEYQEEQKLELAVANVRQVESFRREHVAPRTNPVANSSKSVRSRTKPSRKGRTFLITFLLVGLGTGGGLWYRAQKLGYWGLEKPAPAEVSVVFSTTPPTATLAVDGNTMSANSVSVLPRKTMMLTVSAPGHLTLKQQVQAETDRKKNVAFHLPLAVPQLSVTDLAVPDLSRREKSGSAELTIEDYAQRIGEHRQLQNETTATLEESYKTFTRTLPSKLTPKKFPKIMIVPEALVAESKSALELTSSKFPGAKELNSAAKQYVRSLSKLAPNTSGLAKYLEQESYLRDGFSYGRKMVTNLKKNYKEADTALRRLQVLLLAHETNLQVQELARVEAAEGQRLHWHLRKVVVSARKLVQDPSKGAHRTSLSKSIRALKDYVKVNPNEATQILGSRPFLASLKGSKKRGQALVEWQKQTTHLFNQLEIQLPNSMASTPPPQESE